MERGVFRGSLDDEQRIVFSHVLNGKSGREIAAILGVEPPHVERVVRKTIRQLGTQNRLQAAIVIANHCNLSIDRQTPASSRQSSVINHNGSDSGGISAKSVRTGSAHSSDGRYVRDVDSNGFAEPGAGNILGEIARFFSSAKSNSSLDYLGRILLVAIIVLCSTLALSALVATMQGFNKLINS